MVSTLYVLPYNKQQIKYEIKMLLKITLCNWCDRFPFLSESWMLLNC